MASLGQLGLEKRAGVYDATMIVLAGAVAYLRNVLSDVPDAKIILFNQAALKSTITP